MPVRIPNSLPAAQVLKDENIFVMTERRARIQEIRPLKIAILNLMPTKEVTETQLLRLIGNSPLQIDITLLRTASYQARNVSSAHLDTYYKTFDEVRDNKFDGLIITGAPVEMMEFEEVQYWNELTRIMDWAETHVFSTLYICWAAQAGMYYRYGVPKYELPRKCSGVFRHRLLYKNFPLLRGFDDYFFAPHSRHTEVRAEDIAKVPELQLLCDSVKAGVYLVASRDGKHVFVTGHCEYDAYTLKYEYERDLARGLNPDIPYNYFPDDNPENEPMVRWRSHGNLLFTNWLNYYVYQETPYDIEQIGRR